MDAQHKYPNRPKYMWIFITQSKIDPIPNLPNPISQISEWIGWIVGFLGIIVRSIYDVRSY